MVFVFKGYYFLRHLHCSTTLKKIYHEPLYGANHLELVVPGWELNLKTGSSGVPSDIS